MAAVKGRVKGTGSAAAQAIAQVGAPVTRAVDHWWPQRIPHRRANSTPTLARKCRCFVGRRASFRSPGQQRD